MKYILSLGFLLCVAFNSFSQAPSTILSLDSNGVYSYEKVFDVPGKTKDEIFESIKTWVIKNVKSQSNTNYFDEKDKGTISTNPAFSVSYMSVVDFKLNIEIKDGKYRLSANSFIFHNPQGINKSLGNYSGLVAGKKVRTKILDDVDTFFSGMTTSILESIGKKSDW